MANTRTIEVWESHYDLTKLKKSAYNFHIAKSVLTASGTTVYNTVWQSVVLAPDATVSWNVDYAFNWTDTLPTSGATVVVRGKWQTCAKGQSVDIDDDGFFTTPVNGTDGWMSIGTNNYNPESGGGVNIVVGVKNADTGKYDIIFVDPDTLLSGGSGQWQPQEEVKWWYATGMKTGTMFTQLSSKVATQDLTNPAADTNNYYYSTTYVYDDATWTISQNPPPTTFYAPVPPSFSNGKGVTKNGDVPEIFFWPIVRSVTLSVTVTKAVQEKIKVQVVGDLKTKYADCTVSWDSNSKKMTWSIGQPKGVKPNTLLALGATGDDINKVINTEMQELVLDALIPKGATWTVT